MLAWVNTADQNLEKYGGKLRGFPWGFFIFYFIESTLGSEVGVAVIGDF